MIRLSPDHSAEKAERLSIFSTKVSYASCPTERVKEFGASGPFIDRETRSKSKRRFTGINLLRPKSSHGRARNSSVTQPPTPFSPHNATAPPLPSDASSSASPVWWPPQTAPQVLEWAAHGEDRWAEGWEILSKPSAYSLNTIASSSSSQQGSPGRTGKHAYPIHWFAGRLELGREGTSNSHNLTVHRDAQSEPTINIKLAPVTARGQDARQLQAEACWSISDVQLCHASVFNRDHVISIRSPGYKRPLPAIPLSPPASPSTTARRKANRPSTAAGITGVFGFRPRGRTFSGRDPVIIDQTEASIESRMESAETSQYSNDTVRSPPRQSPNKPTIAQLSAETMKDTTIFLCFETETELQDWFAVLRSFCRNRTPDQPTCHRRLSISVFDLVESAPLSARAKLEHDDKTTDVWSRLSKGETHATTGYVNDSVISKRARALKEGWTESDKLCLEVLVDDMVLGRTSWTKAAEKGSPPFWGETLAFSDLASFSTCVLNLYRQSKGRAILIATIDLPLVADFAKSRDERYPVRSMVDDTLVGEVRLSVAFQEVEILPVERYRVTELPSSASMDILYHLDSRSQLDGLYDTLAKIGLATGEVFPLISVMSDREAQASDRTLFRGNTPLSKLLESTMRMLCHDLLVQSIGPTISRLLDTPEGSGKVLSEDGRPDVNELDRIWCLVEACWTDIYAARGSMPAPARSCLGSLFWAVKRHHPETAELHLPFKAISSFVFLRLLNPAIMRPHLFGLRIGLLPTGPRKTATVLARVMSSMSFFTPKDAPRDPELALFADLIRANSDMMLDYLSTFAISPEPYPQTSVSPAAKFVLDRKSALPKPQADSVPTISVAGPIDLQAEAAILSATLYERRFASFSRSNANDEISSELADQLRQLDENLNLVHTAQHPDPPTAVHTVLSTPPHSRRYNGPRFTHDPDQLPLPTPPPTNRPSADGSHSSTSLVFHTPPTIPDDEHEKGIVSHREIAGAFIRRSLSGKGLRRRGSLPGMRIRPAGREADDPARPDTARR